MRSYEQYCPIARGAEVFAERWTPIIVRNILYGCHGFNEIIDGAPGLSRSLLSRRLAELERAGLIVARPKEDGRGHWYEPTGAGLALKPVLEALGAWGETWIEMRRDHADTANILWSWCTVYLAHDDLPNHRVVIRFDFEQKGGRRSAWMLIEDGGAELCSDWPGFEEDIVVEVEDPLAFALWHAGQLDWGRLLRSGAVRLSGPADLRRMLPRWNSRPSLGATTESGR